MNNIYGKEKAIDAAVEQQVEPWRHHFLLQIPGYPFGRF